MSKLVRAVVAAVATIGFGVVGLGAGTSAGAASAVPYTDANQVGSIGFCDAQNHQIRSGSIEAQPFAAKTVSTVAAPKGYTTPVGRATLYVYQPIQYVDPGDWSGRAMTGSSAFSNNAHPMAEGLRADPSLVNFTAAYPAHLDGFVEFRLYFSAPNAGTYIRPYPAAAVQITGKTWRQIGGPTVDCGAGKVASNELDLPAVQHIQTAGPGSSTPAASGAGTGSGSAGASTSSHPSGASAGPSSGASAEASSPAGTDTTGPASASSKSSSNSGPVIAIVVIVVLLAAGGGYAFLRRRRGRIA
ncbi:hypothetical protein [Jatrophihabitans sp.]|uniref:hypothetical protein n=1 Tax=Jatrophihabitans sp. TaxID=1932789 RepID=UPI0030C76CDC|nr:hypothetical protein [Jatrophihabitans sp.]